MFFKSRCGSTVSSHTSHLTWILCETGFKPPCDLPALYDLFENDDTIYRWWKNSLLHLWGIVVVTPCRTLFFWKFAISTSWQIGIEEVQTGLHVYSGKEKNTWCLWKGIWSHWARYVWVLPPNSGRHQEASTFVVQESYSSPSSFPNRRVSRHLHQSLLFEQRFLGISRSWSSSSDSTHQQVVSSQEISVFSIHFWLNKININKTHLHLAVLHIGSKAFGEGLELYRSTGLACHEGEVLSRIVFWWKRGTLPRGIETWITNCWFLILEAISLFFFWKQKWCVEKKWEKCLDL